MPARSRTSRRGAETASAAGAIAVSVVVPAYNAADTIADTLASVIAQTMPAWEVVVVDDGSHDATGSIAKQFAERDARIRVLRQENGGEAAARNAGIGAARHDWLLFLDADDWIAPDYLARMTQEVVANPGLDAVHCGSARVASDGEVLVERYQPPTGDMFAVWARRSAFPVHACIVRRSLVESVGRFDPSLRKSADWDLWQRIARTGAEFGAVRDVLAYYRMRPHAATHEAELMLSDGLRVLRQGHARDERVPHPHPEHESGLPAEQVPTQAFYLLCWCAGVVLGKREDARPLLKQLDGLSFPGLYPDAVAQCIFDSAPLPTCQSAAAWERLWPAIREQVDAFLAALEAHANAPGLARRAGVVLARMSLEHSPTWRTVIEADDEQHVEYVQTIKRQQSEIDQQGERFTQQHAAGEQQRERIGELEVTLEQHRAAIDELEKHRGEAQRQTAVHEQTLRREQERAAEIERVSTGLQAELGKQQRANDEQARALETNAARILDLEQASTLLESELVEQHRANEEQAKDLATSAAHVADLEQAGQLLRGELADLLRLTAEQAEALATSRARITDLEQANELLQGELADRCRLTAEQAEALGVSATRIVDLEEASELLRGELADLQRLSEQRAARIEELDRANDLLRDEITESERVSGERAMLLADLRSRSWVRLGFQLGRLNPPPQFDAPVPDAIPGQDGGWQLVVDPGSEAHLAPALGERDAVRIAIVRTRGGDRWNIQLNRTGAAVLAQRSYAVWFRARADRSRKIGMGVAQAHAPWNGLGIYRTLRLTPEWQEYCEEFVATADDDNVRIHFDIGRSRSAVEVASVALHRVPEHPEGKIAAPSPEAPDRTALASQPTPSVDHDGEQRATEIAPAGRLRRLAIPRNVASLGGISPLVLSAELLARIEAGELSTSEEGILLGCELRDALDGALDVHNNRWSARRYRDLFGDFYGSLAAPRPRLDGATIVDLGCGGHNPFGLLFLFLMLGARRGIAVDLDEIQDVPRATRALADLAGMLLVNPKEILGEYAISREQMLRNIASFDLVKLQAGDPAGIDPDRLTYRRESVHELSSPDGEADLVISNSFFEHIPRADEAIAQIGRITRPGGVGIHLIDGSDHRRYEDSRYHPLEFLTEAGNAPMVHGSNRIRPLAFGPLFEHHGFEVVAFVSFVPSDQAPLPPGLRTRLREPFRSLSDDVLSAYMGKIVVRKP